MIRSPPYGRAIDTSATGKHISAEPARVSRHVRDVPSYSCPARRTMICALLLGREGSSGFPGKNLLPVLARPLMSYPLLAAQAAPSIERTYVSTDSPRIREIALQ